MGFIIETKEGCCQWIQDYERVSWHHVDVYYCMELELRCKTCLTGSIGVVGQMVARKKPLVGTCCFCISKAFLTKFKNFLFFY